MKKKDEQHYALSQQPTAVAPAAAVAIHVHVPVPFISVPRRQRYYLLSSPLCLFTQYFLPISFAARNLLKYSVEFYV